MNVSLLFGILFSLVAGQLVIGADQSEYALTNAHNQLGWHLYKKIMDHSDEKNVALSPFSIAVALSMVLEGSEGNTKTQLENALKFTKSNGGDAFDWRKMTKKLIEDFGVDGTSKDDNFILAVANQLFSEKTLEVNPKYKSSLKTNFYADIEGVDFVNHTEETRLQMNAWVEKHTMKKIKDMFPSGIITPASRLVLVNAIYFKAAWDSLFEKEFTKVKPFYVKEKEEIKVNMMFRKEKLYYYYDTELKVSVVELPYSNPSTGFVVMVPDERFGLATFEAKLNTTRLMDLLQLTELGPEVSLYLPRFNIESSFSLADSLKQLGVVDLFDASSANLKGVFVEANESVAVSEVLHKVFIEVNEEGTEAAAATGVIEGRMMQATKHKPVTIKVDHPSLFFILNRSSNSILFMGRIGSPTEASEPGVDEPAP